MAYLIGAWIGAILSGYLLLLLFKWPLRRLMADGPLLIWIAVALVYVVAGFVEGYTNANGGEPVFAAAYAFRLLPTIIVGLLDTVHFYVIRTKR